MTRAEHLKEYAQHFPECEVNEGAACSCGLQELIVNEEPLKTECGHCCTVALCADDGEAYVCVNEEACAERREIARLREIISAAEAERATLITHNKQMQAALARALDESGHTKFCRAYQDIGECDCWYGKAWGGGD